MSYTHLTTYERSCLEILSKSGYSTRQIAKELNRHHSTIARELRHHHLDEYLAEEAQISYENRRGNSQPKGKNSAELIRKIQFYLRLTGSPEQISQTVLKGQVSFP